MGERERETRMGIKRGREKKAKETTVKINYPHIRIPS